MDVVATTTMATNLILQLASLVLQAQQAHAAQDQATLDTIHAQIVSMSNAMAPPEGAPAIAVE